MFFGRGYNGLYHCFDRFGFLPGGGWMYLTYFLLIAVAIIAIILVVRSRQRKPGNRALDELNIMFARGEISEEDYLKRKRLLE